MPEAAGSSVGGAAGGTRLFYAGVVLMVLFACGHFAGFLQARHAARHDPKMAELTRAMREQKTRLLGFEPSILDFREYFSVNFSLLMLLAAALNLVAIRLSADSAAAIRTLSLVNVAVMAGLFATSMIYSVVQGLISCGAIAAIFMLAWWRA